MVVMYMFSSKTAYLSFYANVGGNMEIPLI